MVFLNEARLQKGIPRKLQTRRIGPCNVSAKYEPNAYKVELAKEMSISPIFNVKNLIKYKGKNMEDE